jgi:hypothetical protein
MVKYMGRMHDNIYANMRTKENPYKTKSKDLHLSQHIYFQPKRNPEDEKICVKGACHGFISLTTLEKRYLTGESFVKGMATREIISTLQPISRECGPSFFVFFRLWWRNFDFGLCYVTVILLSFMNHALP